MLKGKDVSLGDKSCRSGSLKATQDTFEEKKGCVGMDTRKRLWQEKIKRQQHSRSLQLKTLSYVPPMTKKSRLEEDTKEQLCQKLEFLFLLQNRHTEDETEI